MGISKRNSHRIAKAPQPSEQPLVFFPFRFFLALSATRGRTQIYYRRGGRRRKK